MPTFRATNKHVIPSRLKRFARFLEQFITPTPSREKAVFALNFFLNPGIKRSGPFGVINEFLNPRVRRYGFWKILSQFVKPEPPRSGLMSVISAFLDAPVYRLQQSRDVVRPRQEKPTSLQKLINVINEFLNAYTHFSDLFPDTVVETPSDAFKNALEKLVFSSRLRIERMTEQLMQGKITPRQFQAKMIAEIKKTNIAAGLLGARGIGNLTPSAITAVMDRRIQSEISRLDRFLVDSFGPNFTRPLDEARITENQFRAYANRFASASRASSTIAQSELMKSLYGAAIEAGGIMYMRRVVQGDDRSCLSCVSYASVGWVQVSSGVTLPPPGVDCECESNCRCLLEYCLAFRPGDCPEDYG